MRTQWVSLAGVALLSAGVCVAVTAKPSDCKEGYGTVTAVDAEARTMTVKMKDGAETLSFDPDLRINVQTHVKGIGHVPTDRVCFFYGEVSEDEKRIKVRDVGVPPKASKLEPAVEKNRVAGILVVSGEEKKIEAGGAMIDAEISDDAPVRLNEPSTASTIEKGDWVWARYEPGSPGKVLRATRTVKDLERKPDASSRTK